MLKTTREGLLVLDSGVSDADIAATFEPFVAKRFAAGDPVWEALVDENAGLQRRRRRRRRLTAWLVPSPRTPDSLEVAYSRQWAAQPLDHQVAREGPTVPCLWRGTGMLARSIGIKRVYLLFLARVIARLQPARVLEVGCGNGLNLFALAACFPAVRFTGLELSTGGVAAADGVRRRSALSEAVRDFAPGPVLDPTPFPRIALVRGNAAALPFGAASFDLVFTVLALEQMEVIRARALGEIRRVARGYTAMVEPFADWNGHGAPRDYIVANDYFAASVDDLRRLGLAPLVVTADMPSKLTFRVGLVVCRVDAGAPGGGR